MSVEHDCRQHLDLWDTIAFESPEAGHKHVEQGCQLIRRLPDPPPALLARAHTIRGSSFRAIGDLGRAEECFSDARKLYIGLLGYRREDILDEADLYRRIAYLRMEQQRFGDALEFVHRAATIRAAAEAEHELGRALAAKGTIQATMNDPKAIGTLCLALGKLDPEQNANAYDSTCHNLLAALCQFRPEPELLEAAMKELCRARLDDRSLCPGRRKAHQLRPAGRRRRTMPDARARFLQGRILVLLGQHEEARKLLETAREDFIALGMPLDAAAISIELAECYLWFSDSRRWPRIERLARESLELLRPVPDAPEVVAACQLLMQVAVVRPAHNARQALEKCRARLYKFP